MSGGNILPCLHWSPIKGYAVVKEAMEHPYPTEIHQHSNLLQ